MTGADRRRTLRVKTALPVRVQGFEADGETWAESATTSDVSAGGVSLRLERRVELGQVLLMVLPMPKQLRQYDFNDASYRVYTLVRGIHHGERRVGVMFFGKFPPRGFREHPATRFLLPSDARKTPTNDIAPAGQTAPAARPQPAAPDVAVPPAAPAAVPLPAAPPPAVVPVSPSPSSTTRTAACAPAPAPKFEIPVPEAPDGKERRKHPRYSLFLNFTVQQVDEFGEVLQEELTVADSLCKGGAQVRTTLHFGEGDVVLLQETGGGFATRAEVRAVTRGPDGVGRLHLRFVDRTTPDRILQKS